MEIPQIRSLPKPTFDRFSARENTSSNINPHRQRHRHFWQGQSDLESEDTERIIPERNGIALDVIVPEEGIPAYTEASSCSFIDQRCQVLKTPENNFKSTERHLEQDTFKDIYVKNKVKCDSESPSSNTRHNEYENARNNSDRSAREWLAYILSKITYILVLSLVHLGIIYFSLGILGILVHIKT